MAPNNRTNRTTVSGRQQKSAAISVAAALFIAGCGPSVTEISSTHDDSPAQPETQLGDYVPLIMADWSMKPGQEGYLCATKTLTETLYVGAIRPLSPQGTHHTVVALTGPEGPDSPGFECGASFGQFYAAGVGTGELVLPPGVGLVAPAGQTLFLNLHLFNVGSDVLSGTSGVEVRLMKPSDVKHEASISFYGPIGFHIYPGEKQSADQTDMLSGGQTLFALFPHMHRLGTHFKAELLHNGTPTTLWDKDFQFDSQEFSPISPVTVQEGDLLRTTCTWTNTTPQPITWGNSTNEEMCFSVLMSY